MGFTDSSNEHLCGSFNFLQYNSSNFSTDLLTETQLYHKTLEDCVIEKGHFDYVLYHRCSVWN